MKSIILLSVFFISLLPFGYAAEPSEINSKISNVTVYLHGAQITRQAKIQLQRGVQTIAFRDLPVNIDPQSIQAKGEGNFIILSLLHQVNYLAGQKKTAQVKMLEDSLEIYNQQHDWTNSLLNILKNEEEMLNVNRDLGGKEKSVVLADLKLAVEYYAARMTEIKKEELKQQLFLKKLDERIDRINNQLNVIKTDLDQPTSEVLLNISCNENAEGNLTLTYAVFDAGWIPEYDARAKDVQSPVQLFYNARVFQNTGESWDNVGIKLSTANPQQRGEKPDLQPWFIDFEQPVMRLAEYNSIRLDASEMAEAAPVMEDEKAYAVKKEAETPAIYTEVNENQTNLEFNIRLPYSIPSDNKQYTINIQDFTLPAEYEYYCAPKLDREAFLVARITGWENYNLLSGEINLFFEGTYVGKSALNVRNTEDTLDLSLGRDKSIVVTRIKVKDYTEQKIIGSNKRETRAWEITVRNTKKTAVNLKLEDQLPVSMNKDLEVEPVELTGGKYDKETGLITWKQLLSPSSEMKYRVSYAVKYPKDKRVFID